MKKLILLACMATIMAGCAGRIGSKTKRLVNDGHDYQWVVFYDRSYLVHSPECDSCKSIRRQEIEELINELKEK